MIYPARVWITFLLTAKLFIVKVIFDPSNWRGFEMEKSFLFEDTGSCEVMSMFGTSSV